MQQVLARLAIFVLRAAIGVITGMVLVHAADVTVRVIKSFRHARAVADIGDPGAAGVDAVYAVDAEVVEA